MNVDPYSDAYNATDAPAGAEAPSDPPRGRSRTRSRSRTPPVRSPGASYRSPEGGYRSKRPSPAPRRPPHAPSNPNPTNVLGVFGLSIRTTERDLDDEFSRHGTVEQVTIVYDQRSDRSRGFGFIKMATVEDAERCIKELNGLDLNGRRIRVDFSVTNRPHAPTPGEYMGHRRRDDFPPRNSYYGGGGGGGRSDYGGGRDSYRDRDRDYGGSSRYGRDRDRDPYGRDSRDSYRGGERDSWRDRRSPPPARGGGRYSPDYGRRRRSYSRSPPRGSSPRRDYDAPVDGGSSSRW
ncbi:RNA-binding domain-containing protein [Peniophora sp. CONT]|nr:RNA-binding domain-containing protein [Peniophora sp. CONT]